MGVRRIARRVIAALKPRRPRPAILMYHRVAALSRDPWDLAVHPDLFAAQMAWLRAHRTPMPMDELVDRAQAGTLPASAVGITFDDGYLDNLVNAKPALVQHRVPATVFVASGFTGSGHPFWWDELAGMILDAPSPFHLLLDVHQQPVTLAWADREAVDADPAWRGWDPPQTARQRSYVDLWSRLQSADEPQRAEVFHLLRRHLAAPADPLGLPMTSAQLKELIDGPFITIGGHTVTHRALTDLDRTASRSEIRTGGEQCRALVPQPVQGFAYPYGNFSPEVADDVAQSGFCWACTTHASFLDAEPLNLYSLPRVTAFNLPLPTFIRSLSA